MFIFGGTATIQPIVWCHLENHHIICYHILTFTDVVQLNYFIYQHMQNTICRLSNEYQWLQNHTLAPRGLYRGIIIILFHYDDVIMGTIASRITSLTLVYSIVYSDADQRKLQSSASLAFVWGIHRDRWILRTKGQLRGKWFHSMTSSCRSISFHQVRTPLLTSLLKHERQNPWALQHEPLCIESKFRGTVY